MSDVVLKTHELAKTFIMWEKGLVRKKIKAVESVSFTVQQHEIFGFVGPNGAGKTTIFNCLTGFYRPSGGVIRYRDEEIQGLPGHLTNPAGCSTFLAGRPKTRSSLPTATWWRWSS